MTLATTPEPKRKRLPFIHEGKRYLPIDPTTLGACRLDVDLFLRYGEDSAPVLYRAAGLEFSPAIAQRLVDGGVEAVFVRSEDHATYRRMVSRRFSSLLSGGDVEAGRLAIEAKSICAGLVDDVLASPNEPEAVSAVAEVSLQLAEWATKREDSFELLLEMSSHDYYTATHMVNVSVGCGLLFRALRPKDDTPLAGIIQGGLLHDIGKRDVPAEILTKVGNLTPKEWQIIRRHPRAAYEELRQHAGVSDLVLEMARDHHERLDGKGYPDERKHDEIGLAARVCAVVDVFDALTANRKYRKPLTPHQALAVMTEGAGSHFDAGVLDAWCELVQRVHERRYPGSEVIKKAPARLTLEGFLPHCEISGATAEHVVNGRDRRAHPRRTCETIIHATFVTQGSSCPVPPGQQFPTVALDISQTGVRIRTPWPLSLDDVLELRFSRPDGGDLVRRAKTIRSQRTREGLYVSGLRFDAGGSVTAKKCA